eukprot:scaffold104718_cov33-Prasinocladus_malaysianus.AAC.1
MPRACPPPLSPRPPLETTATKRIVPVFVPVSRISVCGYPLDPSPESRRPDVPTPDSRPVPS